MALTNTDRKIVHDGNGATTIFPFSFPVLDAAHLSVLLTDGGDVETTLSPSLYGVTGIGTLTGGAVTYPLAGSPLAAGSKLTIVRTVPLSQTTVLSNQDGYYPEVVERRFDLVYMKMQEFSEQLSRVVLGSISDPATEQDNLALIQSLQARLGGFDKLTTAGDLLTHDGTSYQRLARGGTGQYLAVNGGALGWVTQPLPHGTISGLGGVWASTTSITVNAGRTYDNTRLNYLALASALTKTMAPWAAGTAAGGLADAGAIANNATYHFHLMRRPDTGTVDICFSANVTTPPTGGSNPVPAAYTQFRRIFSARTNGSGQWLAFVQLGDFFWITQTLDFSASGTSAITLRALSVPAGIVVLPILTPYGNSVNNNSSNLLVAPASNSSVSQTAMITNNGNTSQVVSLNSQFIGPPTNTSAQIYMAVPTIGTQLVVYTNGWVDRRGQDEV